MSLDNLWCAVASASLVTGVSLVSLLQAGHLVRISTPTGCYFSTYITTTDHHQNLVQYAVLGLNE